SGFTALNDSLQAALGFKAGPLYREMMIPELRSTDSVRDLHTVLCFEDAIDIGPDDVYEAVSVLATLQNGTLADFQQVIDDAVAWYYEHGGGTCVFRDNNGDGQIDICSVCCSGANFGEFYSHEGEFNIIDIDNFIEWLLRNPGVPPIYDCSDQVDVSGPTPGVRDCQVDILDLDYMIGYLLRGDYETLGDCI
ncbi:MAG: hypothetical protein JSV52_07825, partial [Candidatus Zixiibacteriota bacterium]